MNYKVDHGIERMEYLTWHLQSWRVGRERIFESIGQYLEETYIL